MKFSWLKLGEFPEISGAMRNWCRSSDIAAVRLPDIILVDMMLQKILSIINFELELNWLDCIEERKMRQENLKID